MELGWREGETLTVATVAELDRVLDAVEAELDPSEPPIVQLRAAKSILTAGLGDHTASVLVYYPRPTTRRRPPGSCTASAT